MILQYNIMESENDDYIYKIKGSMSERIENLVKLGRFEDKEDFMRRAVDVFFAWETNPPGAMAKMMELDPTIPQYAHMINMGMDYSQLRTMYPMYPEKFGKTWENLLADDPTLFKKFQNQKDYLIFKS